MIKRTELVEVVGKSYPEYLTKLLEQSLERSQMNRERADRIDLSRQSVGHSSAFTSIDKHVFESKRTAFLESVGDLDTRTRKVSHIPANSFLTKQ